MVSLSSVSTPASPMRRRQRVRLDASIGARVCKCVSPVKCCQYGFSTQVLTTASSDAAKVCCKYSSPATSRGDSAGRPRVDVKWAPKLRSIACQSISAASRASGWARSICSSSRGRNGCLPEGILGFGPISNLVANCRKSTSDTTLPRKPNSRQVTKTQSTSRSCELFRADYLA